MKLSYLCPNHRAELLRHPEKALKRWQQFYDTGLFYLDHRMHHDAIAHLGSAYETAEIILSHKVTGFHDSLSLFSSSTASLARTYQCLNFQEQCNDVLNLSTSRLRKEQDKSSEYFILIENQIQSLQHFLAYAPVSDLIH